MKSLFNTEAHTEILSRINKLSDSSERQWGKMNVAQMLAHCCEPLKVPLGKLSLQKPNVLMRFLFSFFKESLYNDKPWKQGLPTSKEYKVTNDHNFAAEKDNLKMLIDKFYALRDETELPPHPFCGKLTSEQWGQMQYKHLDHHLRQFGV